MLARDGAAGLEFLMVRRSSRSSFVPDAFVFPGGTADPQDYERSSHGWKERLHEFRATVNPALPSSEEPIGERDALALVHAAVRELSEEANVAIAPSDMHVFSHWITPPTEPRRYNTIFFVARAPQGALGIADAHETHDAQWMTASDALARYTSGDLLLVYPTIKHFERVAHISNTAELLAFAQTKPIVTIMPSGSPTEYFVMPPELENQW
jgi:recombination protein RecT